MIISHELKFVYIGIPRTGSKSMMQWLANYPSMYIDGHHRWEVPKDCKDYLVFTVVRNPYDRWASGNFALLWDGETPDESKRVPSPLPAPVTKPLAERLCESADRGITPGNEMNQSQFVRKGGVQLALYFEKLPGCLGELPFVDADNIPEFPCALERGIRPSGTFFDHFSPDDEKCVWAYATEDFKGFGYRRYECGLPEGSVVLDGGAGSGEISCFLAAEYKWQVIALEPAKDAVKDIQDKANRRNLNGLVAIQGDLTGLCLADESVDGIFCQGVFEMLTDRRRQALCEMKRVVKDGGTIAIGGPFLAKDLSESEAVRIYGDNDCGFRDEFRTLEWNIELAEDVGLKVATACYHPESRRLWDEYYAPLYREDGTVERKEEVAIWERDQGAYHSLGVLILNK